MKVDLFLILRIELHGRIGTILMKVQAYRPHGIS